MADSSLSILDSTGTTVALDAQLPAAGERQQTVTIGDGITPGRVATLDTDGAQLVKTNPAATVTKTNVASSLTSGTILAANAARRGALIFNDSTAQLWLSYGTSTTSATSFSVKVAAAGLYVLDVPVWTGAVTGMWAAVNGSARVTDLSV